MMLVICDMLLEGHHDLTFVRVYISRSLGAVKVSTCLDSAGNSSFNSTKLIMYQHRYSQNWRILEKRTYQDKGLLDHRSEILETR